MREKNDIITVEIERKELEKVCLDEDDPECWRCWKFTKCKRDVPKMIWCLIRRDDIKYKIRVQK